MTVKSERVMWIRFEIGSSRRQSHRASGRCEWAEASIDTAPNRAYHSVDRVAGKLRFPRVSGGI